MGLNRAGRQFPALLSLLLGVLALSGGGCQYLSGRNETVGSALYKSEPDIRVRVRKATDAVQIDAPAHIMARNTGVGPGPVTLTTPVAVTSTPRGITLVDSAGASHEMGYGNTVEILPGAVAMDPSRGSVDEKPKASAKASKFTTPVAVDAVKLDGSPLPGVISFRPRTDEGGDRFDVIAEMPVETYLPGVLDGELYANWSLGTFEIQAVAARTYALHEREQARRQGAAFDVESTTADQVFRGLTKNPVATDAARRTRGEVVTYRGQLVKTYYSSTCGGRPGSASDVWPTGTAYESNSVSPLTAKERTIYCQASPYFRWEITRGDDDVSARIRAWGAANSNDVRRMGRIRKADMSRANRIGRPVEFKLTDDKGNSFRIGAEQLRTACNFPAPNLPAITRETRVPSGDLQMTTWADQVKFTGQGFGHGVGMCQWCAKGMGERDIPYQQALTQFYPGAAVVKAY